MKEILLRKKIAECAGILVAFAMEKYGIDFTEEKVFTILNSIKLCGHSLKWKSINWNVETLDCNLCVTMGDLSIVYTDEIEVVY